MSNPNTHPSSSSSTQTNPNELEIESNSKRSSRQVSRHITYDDIPEEHEMNYISGPINRLNSGSGESIDLMAGGGGGGFLDQQRLNDFSMGNKIERSQSLTFNTDLRVVVSIM